MGHVNTNCYPNMKFLVITLFKLKIKGVKSKTCDTHVIGQEGVGEESYRPEA